MNLSIFSFGGCIQEELGWIRGECMAHKKEEMTRTMHELKYKVVEVFMFTGVKEVIIFQ